MRSEEGFTLVELLIAMALSAILLILSAVALRNYWWNQTFEGAAEELVSQLRQVQERTDSESHPLVYGVRFRVGTGNWAIVRYDPSVTSAPCTLVSAKSFAAGVEISAASFAPPRPEVDVTKCPESAQQFVFFYARGSATPGTVTLSHVATGRTRTITVLPLTGRVKLS